MAKKDVMKMSTPHIHESAMVRRSNARTKREDARIKKWLDKHPVVSMVGMAVLGVIIAVATAGAGAALDAAMASAETAEFTTAAGTALTNISNAVNATSDFIEAGSTAVETTSEGLFTATSTAAEDGAGAAAEEGGEAGAEGGGYDPVDQTDPGEGPTKAQLARNANIKALSNVKMGVRAVGYPTSTSCFITSGETGMKLMFGATTEEYGASAVDPSAPAPPISENPTITNGPVFSESGLSQYGNGIDARKNYSTTLQGTVTALPTYWPTPTITQSTTAVRPPTYYDAEKAYITYSNEEREYRDYALDAGLSILTLG